MKNVKLASGIGISAALAFGVFMSGSALAVTPGGGVRGVEWQCWCQSVTGAEYTHNIRAATYRAINTRGVNGVRLNSDNAVCTKLPCCVERTAAAL